MNELTDNSNLTFTFEGDYAVEITAISKAFDGLATLTKTLADSQYPDVTFTLSVRAITPGSLNFEFVALSQVVNNLFTVDSIGYAKNLISLVINCFKVKQFLKNKLPKNREIKNDKIEITNENGQKILLPKDTNVYFINNSVDKSVTNIFEGVKTSDTVTGIKVSRDNSETVRIPHSEFAYCAENIDFDKQKVLEKSQSFIRKNEILYIRKPDLMGSSQWGFKSDKNITADVLDQEFLTSVQSGVQVVYAGMYIIADVSITCKLDNNNFPIENSYRYSIIKVREINPPENKQITIK